VKRILMVLTVALLMAVVLVVTVAPAFAISDNGIAGRVRGAAARALHECQRLC